MVGGLFMAWIVFSDDKVFDANRLPSCAPSTGTILEYTGTWSSAGLAKAILGEMPFGDDVCVTADELLSTLVAVGAAARLVAHIAGVGVSHACFHGDFSRTRES